MPTRPRRPPPEPLALILVTIYLDVFTYAMVAPVLPVLVVRRGGGPALAGLLGSLYAGMQLLSGPVLGPLSDRLGRRPILLGCLFGTALAYLTLGLGEALPFVVLAVTLDGLTGGNLTTAQAYVADVTPPESRARGLARVGAAMGLGLMTGPALGGLLGAYDLRWPAYAGCATAVLNILIGLWLLPESLPPARRAARLNWRGLHLGAQLREVLARPALRPLLLTLFTLNLAFAGLQSNFPLFSQARFSWGTLQIGIFFAFVGMCAVVTQGFLVGRLAPRWGEPRLVRLGVALMSLMLAGVALAPRAWLLYPLVGAAALGTSLGIPALTSLISRAVEPEAQGRVLGGVQSVLSLTAILGPSLAGLTFERLGPPAPYWLGAAFGLVSLATALLSLRAAPRAPSGGRRP